MIMKIISEVYGQRQKGTHGIDNYLYEVTIELDGRRYTSSQILSGYFRHEDLHSVIKRDVQRNVMEFVREHIFK